METEIAYDVLLWAALRVADVLMPWDGARAQSQPPIRHTQR